MTQRMDVPALTRRSVSWKQATSRGHFLENEVISMVECRLWSMVV